jgi:hypothetical protein
VRRVKYAWLIGLALLAAFMWLITRPAAATALVFAADRWVLGFIVAAIHASTSVSRRKPALLAETESSWLAALPYRVSTPARIAFGFGVQLAVVGVLCAGIAAVSSASWPDARAAWLGVFAGYVAGGLAGWFAHAIFPAGAGGAAQYAIVRQVRKNWAVAPRLHPLSYWPVAWARTLNNPQVSARTMLFVLLALPMGTTGEEALAFGAGWMVGLYVLLNLVATVRTAFAAGWWLTPTPVLFGPFTRTLVSRVLLIQASLFAAALVFIGALGEPRMLYAALGGSVAWLVLYTGIAVLACSVARR